MESETATFRLSPEQAEARRKILEYLDNDSPGLSPMRIGGAAGTGKSTLIRTVVRDYAESNPLANILCLAPTHKAVGVLVGAGLPPRVEASTLHSALGLRAHKDTTTGVETFVKKADSRIPFRGVVIVDEASMLDQPLFVALLRALVPGTRLVLVGDADQLPSVGPGNVLAWNLSSSRRDNLAGYAGCRWCCRWWQRASCWLVTCSTANPSSARRCTPVCLQATR